jgi:hypothetical protein
MTELLPEEKRQEIFLNLVEKQDAGTSVEQSRLQVADAYELDLEALRAIEREGLLQKWPPLSE